MMRVVSDITDDIVWKVMMVWLGVVSLLFQLHYYTLDID